MISERYVVGDVVGAGAFATVYRAMDPRLNSPVAIKVLAENWSADPAVCERFGREAMLLRRVRSDRRGAPLVEVFDIDQSGDGRPFFVMSFADGGTLAERYVQNHPWPPAAVREVVETLGEGLHALHAADIVHRDIKPSNLLYVSQVDAPSGEELLIGDLGLAKDLLIDATELTIAGGTPGYMAPEQQMADVRVTPAADVYSASVIVSELLTGQRGLAGVEHLPDQLRAEVRRGTSVQPADRHQSIKVWRDAMLAGLSAPPPLAPDARSPMRPALGVLAAIVVALVVVAVLALRSNGADISIVGPDNTQVGETVFLRAEVPQGGTHVWTVSGTTVTDLDLRLTPQSPGTVVVQLDYTSPDGATTPAEHTIVVTNGG